MKAYSIDLRQRVAQASGVGQTDREQNRPTGKRRGDRSGGQRAPKRQAERKRCKGGRAR